MSEKITSFTDLVAWKEAHRLVLLIYKILEVFPPKSFSLVDQLSRCAVSISSNIAEGFSRKSKKEKIQFLYMALGSLTELQNQLLIARDIGYVSKEKFNEGAVQSIQVSKLINGLIKYLKKSSAPLNT